MRTWLIVGLLIVLGASGLMYVSLSPLTTSPAEVDVNPEKITNPLYFPKSVGIFLLLSICSYAVSRPGSSNRYSPTESGLLGAFGSVSWFVAAMSLGGAGLFLISDVVEGYFHVILISSAMSQAVFFTAAVTFLFYQHKRDQLMAFVEIQSWQSALVRGTVGYLRLFPLLLVATMVNVYLFRWFDVELTVPYTIQFFAAASTLQHRVLLFLLLVIVAPVCEEYFFRGVIYNVCREWASPEIAAIGSSFIFSAVHREPIWFLPVLILGYYLAREYEQTDGLRVPFVVHTIQNGLSFAMLYFALG